jgi:hypothetical protein
LRALLPLALLPVLLLLAWLLHARFALTGPYDGRYAEPFDREAWRAAADDPDGARFLMVDDLLGRRLLEGLTLEQAGALLGPPSTAKATSFGPCWYLGPEASFLSVDSAWLVLDLEGGRIVGAHVATD